MVTSRRAPGDGLVLAVVVLIALHTACDVATSSGTYEYLTTQPEADLVYPESDLLSDGGYDAEMTIDGPQPAALWKIFGSDASIDDILAHYQAELADRGWESMPSSRSTSEIEAWRWSRGDLGFRLGQKDPDTWHERLPGSDRFATIYEVRLVERRSS